MTYSSWRPHVCTDETEVLLPKAPGFGTKLVRDALVDQGFEVLFTPHPFARQLKDVTRGRQDAVLHIMEAPDRHCGWPGVSTDFEQLCSVVQKDNPWHHDGIASLDAMPIGAISGFKFGILSNYMDDPANGVGFLSGDKTDLRDLEKVARGWIDAFLDNSIPIA